MHVPHKHKGVDGAPYIDCSNANSVGFTFFAEKHPYSEVNNSIWYHKLHLYNVNPIGVEWSPNTFHYTNAVDIVCLVHYTTIMYSVR